MFYKNYELCYDLFYKNYENIVIYVLFCFIYWNVMCKVFL
ncbi:hypothetical protein C530_044 [Candidatus Portiera aleyrodidarum BT-B-HRs]|nr:hypothetical protein C548_043 [Candidatus Portiera aleyrodidarum BT-QVLC]AFT80690.1 hypothetical protein C530_044 [Candidatus Portiera aleyrodidarum BT-B-HRs]